MPPVLPPAPQKKGSHSQQAAINYILKRYPGLRRWMPTVYEAAGRWRIDPVFVLSIMSIEAGSGDPNARSGAGAAGLAQMYDSRVNRSNNPGGYAAFISQFGDRHRGGKDQALNPVWAINYLAWRMRGHLNTYGNIDDAYHKGYNPHQPQVPDPSSRYPGWYLPRGAQTPSDQAAAAAERKQAGAQQSAGNPWLQGQNFLDYWHQRIDPIWEAYTGRAAHRGEARDAISKGYSDYHLQLMLASRKTFIGSPIWRSQAPGYQSVYREIYGDLKPDARTIAFAIVHNLGATGFAEQLRQGKGYVKSTEFQGNVATLQNVYQSIFGHPDENGLYVIKQATLHGWTTDQFAKYLRAQPEYQHSEEFRGNAEKLAAVFGGQPTLTAAEALAPPAPHQGVPQDPRLGPAPWEPPAAKPAPKPVKKAKPAPRSKPRLAPTPTGMQP